MAQSTSGKQKPTAANEWRDVATRGTVVEIAQSLAELGEARTQSADEAFVARVMKGFTNGNKERVDRVRTELERRGLRPTPKKGRWAIIIADEVRWTADVALDLFENGPFEIFRVEGPATEREFFDRRDDFAGIVSAPGSDTLRLRGMWPTPVVLYDCRPEHRLDIDNIVEVDQFEAGRLATLRCLDLGHQRIVMMCRPGATGRDRRDGYLSALADWGMLGKARVVIVDSASARTLDRFPFPQEPGKIERFVHPAGVQAAAAQATLNLAAECDAIISANSSLTLGVRSALVGLADGRPHHVGFSARDTAVAGEDEIVPPRKRVTETILEHIRAIRSGRVSPNSQPIPPSLETISENGSTRSPQRPTLSVRAGERHLPDR